MAGSQRQLIESRWNFTRGECVIAVICLEPGPDTRCFCPRLNSSLKMWTGLIIHKAEMG